MPGPTRLRGRTPSKTRRTATAIVIALLLLPASAEGAFTGSLTVDDVTGTTLTFTAAVQYSCEGRPYCGWFAAVRQTTPDRPCTTLDDPLWVGEITESPSMVWVQTVQPYGWATGPAPIRLCLVAFNPDEQLVGEALYPPPPPPGPVIPPPGSPAPIEPPLAPEPTPTLTGAEARRYARVALRSRYRARYTRGTGLRVRCLRVSRLRFRCLVSWRHRGRYRGQVSLWATSEDGESFVHWRVRVRYIPDRARGRPRRQPPRGEQPRGGCHPSYPTLCIPAPPPDVDCRDVGRRNFPVRGSDPHRLDADADGVGCEA